VIETWLGKKTQLRMRGVTIAHCGTAVLVPTQIFEFMVETKDSLFESSYKCSRGLFSGKKAAYSAMLKEIHWVYR
jgi:hypothetical protein